MSSSSLSPLLLFLLLVCLFSLTACVIMGYFSFWMTRLLMIHDYHFSFEMSEMYCSTWRTFSTIILHFMLVDWSAFTCRCPMSICRLCRWLACCFLLPFTFANTTHTTTRIYVEIITRVPFQWCELNSI